MFSQRLKSLRKDKGLTQKELGHHFNLSQSSIAFYEKGEREPDFATLIKFADFFDVSTDYLLGLSYTTNSNIKLSIPFIDSIQYTKGETNLLVNETPYPYTPSKTVLDNKRKLFLYKITDDSMKDAGIVEGATVLLEKDAPYKHEDILLILDKKEEKPLIRKILFKDQMTILKPENHAYDPLVVTDKKNYIIIGKIIQVEKEL